MLPLARAIATAVLCVKYHERTAKTNNEKIWWHLSIQKISFGLLILHNSMVLHQPPFPSCNTGCALCKISIWLDNGILWQMRFHEIKFYNGFHIDFLYYNQPPLSSAKPPFPSCNIGCGGLVMADWFSSGSSVVCVTSQNNIILVWPFMQCPCVTIE